MLTLHGVDPCTPGYVYTSLYLYEVTLLSEEFLHTPFDNHTYVLLLRLPTRLKLLHVMSWLYNRVLAMQVPFSLPFETHQQILLTLNVQSVLRKTKWRCVRVFKGNGSEILSTNVYMCRGFGKVRWGTELYILYRTICYMKYEWLSTLLQSLNQPEASIPFFLINVVAM